MIVEMVSQYQNFSSMASLFNGTLVSFSDSRIRAIKTALFANQSNLVSVNLPKCRIIGSYAFSGCGSLTSIWHQQKRKCASKRAKKIVLKQLQFRWKTVGKLINRLAKSCLLMIH